ncbi:MAG: Demethylrebeccamycin-D-glucose O-methyltransferase [Candidatus Heimdallarchaeota archaeon LC_3]|nr:MAG: Demethylrebeccamycin-D-glucose O-methyltransferase [Candidatus Heimdallarchaeota archaeon LC_3]
MNNVKYDKWVNQVPKSVISKTEVANYFNDTISLYAALSKDHVHHGLWDELTNNYKDAVLNTTKIVVDSLGITNGDIVLDAGCGVGGSCRFIVSKYDAKTIGITLSESHLKKAQELSLNTKNSNLMEFQKQDFTKTTFPDESFTKIFALESSSHVSNQEKIKLIQEAYRLLKKGGKFVILDGFRIRLDLDREEQKIYDEFLIGLAVAEFDTKESFTNKLQQAGFKNIIYQDKKEEVLKTTMYIYKKGKRWHRISWLLSNLRLIPNSWHGTIVSCIREKKLFEKNLGTYGLFVSEK